MLSRDLVDQAIKLCEDTHLIGVDVQRLSAPLLIVHAGPSPGHKPTVRKEQRGCGYGLEAVWRHRSGPMPPASTEAGSFGSSMAAGR